MNSRSCLRRLLGVFILINLMVFAIVGFSLHRSKESCEDTPWLRPVSAPVVTTFERRIQYAE